MYGFCDLVLSRLSKNNKYGTLIPFNDLRKFEVTGLDRFIS